MNSLKGNLIWLLRKEHGKERPHAGRSKTRINYTANAGGYQDSGNISENSYEMRDQRNAEKADVHLGGGCK